MLDLWIPDPKKRITLRGSGTGDMGDVTDEASVARFGLPTAIVEGRVYDVALWCLVGFRLKIKGGSGDATLSLKLDHRDTSGLYDFTLREWENVGNDSSSKKFVNHRVNAIEDLFALYTFESVDQLVFVWPNPDVGVMTWAIEVTLAWVSLAVA